MSLSAGGGVGALFEFSPGEFGRICFVPIMAGRYTNTVGLGTLTTRKPTSNAKENSVILMSVHH